MWLLDICTSYLNLDIKTANGVAEKFKGFGPEIYLMKQSDWVKLVGEGNGRSVYTLLVSVRREKGAIPRNIRMFHGNANHALNKPAL
jgi:hypothetical protein